MLKYNQLRKAVVATCFAGTPLVMVSAAEVPVKPHKDAYFHLLQATATRGQFVTCYTDNPAEDLVAAG
jgi:hypothetical protein